MVTSSEKVEFRNSEGHVLAGRLELPVGEPRAMALFAHCFTCSKDIAAATRISRALCHRGIAVLRFDFTGLGNSEGDFSMTDFSSNVEDLVDAAAYLREHYQAPSLLVGHSLGGAAVLMAAHEIPEVQAICTIAAPSEPGHVRHLLSDELENIEAAGSAKIKLAGREFTIRKQFLDDLDEQRTKERLRGLRHAVLIFHSPVDEIVDIDHARRIYESVLHPKSFVSLDDADHLLSRKEDSEYVAEVLSAWASRYVATGAAPAQVPEPVERGVVVVEEQDGGLAQAIRAGNHLLVADEPRTVKGGTDTGPTPYDLLLSALGACTTMTLRMYANHKGLPLEGVRVRLRHDRIHAKDCVECESKEGRIDRIDREIDLRGPLDDAQRARMLEIADRCPVHRTLENEKQIRTSPWESP